ncbi:MAG: lactonase family protein, partial [Candidatus Poribacteria bacterium]|nr:lactonase family protein [Candidatus Poribacteria bacterium]
IDAGNRYAFSPDLGIDKVLIYELDAGNGKLTPNTQPWARVHPGAGPRHFDFHPNGAYAYVINELDSTFTAFRYNASAGTLTEFQTISTLPDDFDGRSHCADVHVHPSGKFLYGSNRGHDSIAICAIDAETGTLSPIGHESTQGQTPRNFGLNPEGTFLFAANQQTDTVVTFAVNQETGELTATGHVTEVPMPVCLKMVPCV